MKRDETETPSIEERYNNLCNMVKEDIGFPTGYLFLTAAQETFIIDILKGHEKIIKKDLSLLLEDMKELIDDI